MGKLQKLKSLIKWNKLFHYQFKIPNELFYQLKIKTYFIEINDDYVICYGNKKLFSTLIKYEVEYVDQYKLFYSKVLIKRLIMILTFVLINVIFFSSSYFIREIKFKDPSMYDDRIYNYVHNKLDKKMFLYTINDNLNNLSLSLRAAFPNYAYIGITKNGSSLVIDVEKIELKNNKSNIKVSLPIISNYNAVIYSISCTNGVVMVNLNQSVKKGETLVTPNIEDGYCDALILGKMSEYETVRIKKEKLDYNFTGRMKKKIGIKVGKNYLMKFKDYYKDQELNIENKISLFNYLSLVDIYYYEKDYVTINYDYDTAYNYAVSKFYYNLELYRKSPLEKINDIILINYVETSDEFVFYFLVNRIKSIGIYSY